MKLLWTKRNSLGSKLIEWGTDGDCSHFAVVFDDKPGGYGLVFHSTLTSGVNIDWLGDFEKSNEVVHVMVPACEIDEEVIYQSLVQRFYHKGYDKLAYIYFALRVLLFKGFGVKLPVKNLWGDKNRLLCTEMAKALKDSGVMGLPDLADYAMISPYSLYQIMKSAGHLWKYY